MVTIDSAHQVPVDCYVDHILLYLKDDEDEDDEMMKMKISVHLE